MKKTIFSFVLATGLLVSLSSFAHEAKPNYKVEKAFKVEFRGIMKVNWTELQGSGIYVADFEFNGGAVRAYFSEEGEFLGTARSLNPNQLPIMVTTELARQYPEAKISDASELSLLDGVDYYVTLLTPKGSLIIKATGTGDLTVHQRQKTRL